MELSERLVQVKSTAKEEELLEYTPDDIVCLSGDVIRPVGLILNHNDSTECHALFPPAAPMSDIYKLSENPSWAAARVKAKAAAAMLSLTKEEELTKQLKY